MKASTVRSLKQEAVGIAFLLPALILLTTFVILPMIESFRLSFYSYNMATSVPKFIGLRNFQKLFSGKEIYDTIGRTLTYAVIILPTTLILGFTMGLLLSSQKKINVVYRTILFAPRVTSMVAISSVWLFILHPQYGMFNLVFGLLGLPPVRWLNSPDTALLSIAMITVWRMLGYSTIVFIGGIQNISTDVLEAATIDGASRRQQIWHIIFPLVSPTTFMLMILNTIDILKMFTTINVMTGGGPAKSTQNLVVMLYDYAFDRYQIGFASAISVVLFLIILTINVVQRLLEKKVHYDQ